MALPILMALGKIGAGLLARVVQKKGEDFIKEKIGIDLPKVLAENGGVIPDDVAMQLKRYEMDNEEELNRIALEVTQVKAEVITTTSGHAMTVHGADMKSDSWLSKNIRPLALIAVLYAVLHGLYSVNVDAEKYREVVGLCKRAFEFYFGGRSLEKISGGVIERGKSLINKIRGK